MSLRKAFSKKGAGKRHNFQFDDLYDDDEHDYSSSVGSSHPTPSQKTPGGVRVTPPRTAAQRRYHEAIEGPSSVVVCCGPAGSGKTMVPCEFACRFLEEGRFQRVILVRPAVPAQEDLGFLPGAVLEKLDPYLRPLYDFFEAVYDKKRFRQMMDAGVVEACAIGYCRGRTFRNSLIIADEMQNATEDQVKMLLTRLGPGSKMVLTGDPTQHDRGYGSQNGLSDFVDRWERYERKVAAKLDAELDAKLEPELAAELRAVEIVRFGRADILRNPVIEHVLRAYEG